ncbi:MAG TPA: hypothetical protein VGA55_08760 [Bacteroidota bacterium]
MKIDWGFLKWVGLCYVLLTGAATMVLLTTGAPQYEQSVVAGSLMSIVNFLLGFISVEYAFDKSHTVFLKMVLGGMVGRLFAMALMVLILIKAYDFDSLSLMLALLGFYVVNLGLEIAFLQKKVTLKNKISSP